jgi:hypothetical protein
MFLQEWLFRTAMAEVGIDLTGRDIAIDHKNGTERVGKSLFSLKYPRDYLARADAIPLNRKYMYVFSGNMAPSGERGSMLAPFERPDSMIEANNTGRDPKQKYRFNPDYYALMRSSRFALCPHQKNWNGPPATAWTYRFVEACFSRTLPIVFREAPCGAKFLDGFEYFWDDQPHDGTDYDRKIEQNHALVLERFFLTADDIARVRAELAAAAPAE